jgi:hypothetical protein
MSAHTTSEILGTLKRLEAKIDRLVAALDAVERREARRPKLACMVDYCNKEAGHPGKCQNLFSGWELDR